MAAPVEPLETKVKGVSLGKQRGASGADMEAGKLLKWLSAICLTAY